MEKCRPLCRNGAKRTDPIPWRPMVVLCMCNVAHFYSICSLFSYAGIMTTDLHWVESRDEAGFVAGFLASANVLGRVPTCILWGRLTDRFGVRICLMLSCISIAAGNIAFALSSNLYVSLATRFLFLGCGNGWATVSSVLVFETAGCKERQAKVIGITFAAGGFVQLLGPAVGGLTYGVWDAYPALIPSGIGAALAVMAFVVTSFWLPRAKEGYARTKQEESEERPNIKVVAKHTEQKKGYAKFEEQSESAPDTKIPATEPEDIKKESWCAVIGAWPMPLIITMRSLQGLLIFATFDLIPLWCISSESMGGLDMSETDLGALLSTSALGGLIFNSLIMHRITSCLGLRRAVCTSTICTIVALTIMPFLKRWSSLLFVYSVFACCANLSAALCVALTNNAAPDEARGMVNGVAATLESIGKGIGPMGAASFFAWTLSKWGKDGHQLTFWLLAASTMSLLGAGILPAYVEGANNSPEGGDRQLSQRLQGAPKAAVIGTTAAKPTNAEEDQEFLKLEAAGGVENATRL